MSWKITFGVLTTVIVCAFGGVVSYKLYHHQRMQDRQIADLLSRDEYMMQKLEQTAEYYKVQPSYRDDAYNYLAIGNSLTLIPSWGRGICATEPDGDYFGRVKQKISERYGDVEASRLNFATWELAYDRTSRLDLLDLYLSDKLNLVTIQLGENVRDVSQYEPDLERLIVYVRQRAPKARIIVIGDFWDKDKNQHRQQAASNQNVSFADLSQIIGDKGYQSKEGTMCQLEDGTLRKVTKEEETHPGDSGMEYIAEQVMHAIGE